MVVPTAHSTRARRVRRGHVLAVAAAGVTLLGAHLSAAAYTSSSATGASFGSASCYYRASVQSGTTTSTANGTTSVTITSVDMTRSFLMFSTRHSSNRPVGSAIGGRLASSTSIEFVRTTNEGSPVTMTIEWSVIEYQCGVTVQRGSASQTATSVDVTISAVPSLAQSFVLWSKHPLSTDTQWGGNDSIVAELTSTTNLLLRADATGSGHTIFWQVVVFADASAIAVQRGTTSLTGTATSTSAALPAVVDVAKSFVLVDSRSSGSGSDIGSAMVRGRLTGTTTVTVDRSIANYDVTEIGWQVVELRDGSSVQSGNASLASGTGSATPSLTAVTLARTTAFASTQTGGGQNGGRTDYTADDIIGVAAFGLKLTTTTQLTLTRSNTSAAADVAWFVVSWGIA